MEGLRNPSKMAVRERRGGYQMQWECEIGLEVTQLYRCSPCEKVPLYDSQ